jgi:GNAT superfamily N-acetyltransferase
MALELDRLPIHQRDDRVELVSEVPEYGSGFGQALLDLVRRQPHRFVHAVARVDGAYAGHATAHIVDGRLGGAGVYDVDVAPRQRRKGLGRALTLAVCRAAARAGATTATLNATGEGELLYRAVGFESLGWGQTWWYSAGPEPTPRQVALAEAIGFGDMGALASIAPTPAELVERLPGDTSPLRLAVVTDRLESAHWMLGRAPWLVRRRFEPFGGTLLHLAVEWDRPEFARLALERGADPGARDRTYRGTPLQWVEHTGATATGAVLAASPS